VLVPVLAAVREPVFVLVPVLVPVLAAVREPVLVPVLAAVREPVLDGVGTRRQGSATPLAVTAPGTAV